METIHAVGGWRSEMPLFRVEGRFTREVLREIAAGMNLAQGDWCDDPWLALDHLSTIMRQMRRTAAGCV